MYDSVLVKTHHNNSNLELLIQGSSTIFDLIQSLRENTFVYDKIPDSKLICRNIKKAIVDGNSSVSSLIPNEDRIYELFLDVNIESLIEQVGGEKFEQRIVKTLQLIINKIKGGKVDYLLAAQKNNTIPPAIGQKLSEIGRLFQKPTNQNLFYRDSLKHLTDSAFNEDLENKMNDVYFTHMDNVDHEAMNNIKNLVNIIQNIRSNLQSKEDTLQTIQNDLQQRDQKISTLQRKFRYESTQMQDSLLQLKSQIEKCKTQINQLTIQNQSKDLQIQNAQNDLKSSEQRIESLEQRLELEKSAFKTESNRIKKQLTNNSMKTDELVQALQQKQLLLAQKDQQIKKIKENSVDKKIVSLTDKLLKNQAPFPSLNAPKIGRLQDILIDSNLATDLKNIIETQMKKPISKIHELLSYDRRDHMIYSLKQNFQILIDQKRSLLLIALSEGPHGKFFGAFTEEKYDMAPSSYFIPDFNGCSFLFSLINKRFEHFKILDGENSIVFDLDSLVLGEEDLVLDFEKSSCSSKFTEGKSDVFNTDSESGNGRDLYKLFLSDKQPEKGKSHVNLVQYKIYQIQFD